MLEIKLNASFENWKQFWGRRRHPKFKQMALRVLERDHSTCQYCEFSAQGIAFEIVNQDNNYHNNSLSNLVTACPLCAQCFFLESIGTGSFGGGVLVYLPEINQNQLNALCLQAFMDINGKSSKQSIAENILRDFRFRSSDVEKVFGDNMSDPAKFGLLILTANLDAYARERILQPLRLLPVAPRFAEFTQAAVEAMTPVVNS